MAILFELDSDNSTVNVNGNLNVSGMVTGGGNHLLAQSFPMQAEQCLQIIYGVMVEHSVVPPTQSYIKF